MGRDSSNMCQMICSWVELLAGAQGSCGQVHLSANEEDNKCRSHLEVQQVSDSDKNVARSKYPLNLLPHAT